MSNIVSVEGALQSLKLYKLQRCFSLCDDVLEVAINALEEIQQYRAIGTVSEFRELKEKATEKKPTPIDYEKYMDVVTNAKFLRGAYWCPCCKHTVRSGAYCDDCGQKLIWA